MAGQPHVALLRGINVGGRNKLPMKELAAIFEDAGCGDVRTWIQSGNVVFRAPAGGVGGLAADIQAEIERRYEVSSPVILRSAAEWADVVARNPWLATDPGGTTLHVALLADEPDDERVDSLDPDRSPGDELAVRGRAIYLRLPNGVARTKLTNAYFDRVLGTVSTMRNWRTVRKIESMLELD